MPEPSAANQAPHGKPAGGERPPVVGDFALLERIGQGAMGTVFRARQQAMDRTVAVKVLLPKLASDAAYVERFFREARAAARLNHPNIVLALTVGEDHGYYYFAMEYVEGHTVSLLLKAGPLEERRALEIALQIARALDYAWSQERIVHRDIKPGNILITPEGAAKLADLGLAHEASLEEESALEADGKIVGTPFYIAPEQILRRPDLDVRCDLYALGATLFHMVTGRPPFEGPTTKAVLNKQLREPVPDPRVLRPQLSEGTAYILQKLLAKDRDERYPDAKALAADIEATLRGDSVVPRQMPSLRVRRYAARQPSVTFPILLALLVILALIALVVVGLGSLSRSGSSGRGGGPTPRVKTAIPPPVDPHYAAAEQAWREAEAYADARSSDPLKAIARLRDVERRFHDTTFAEKAGLLRHRLEADLERSNKEAFRSLVERAEALAEKGRYAEALALFERLAPGLAADGWHPRVATARAAIEVKARDALRATLARGDELAKRGEFDEAIRAYEAGSALLPEALRAEVAERVAEARRRQKEGTERAKAEHEAAELRLLAEILDLYRARKYGGAAELARRHVETAPAEYRAELTQELAEAEKLQEIWARAERGDSHVLGRPFTIRGIQGELVSVKNGRVTIRTPGGSFSEELKGLGSDQILTLVLPWYTSVDAPLAAARFLAAEGKLDAAEARLKAAGSATAEAAALAARIRRLGVAAALAAASKELAEGRKLLDAGDATGAAAAFRAFLARFGKQPAAAALCAEAERLLKQATAAGQPVKEPAAKEDPKP